VAVHRPCILIEFN